MPRNLKQEHYEKSHQLMVAVQQEFERARRAVLANIVTLFSLETTPPQANAADVVASLWSSKTAPQQPSLAKFVKNSAADYLYFIQWFRHANAGMQHLYDQRYGLVAPRAVLPGMFLMQVMQVVKGIQQFETLAAMQSSFLLLHSPVIKNCDLFIDSCRALQFYLARLAVEYPYMTTNKHFLEVTENLMDLDKSLTELRAGMNELIASFEVPIANLGVLDPDSTYQQWKNYRPEGEFHLYPSTPHGWSSQSTIDTQILKK